MIFQFDINKEYSRNDVAKILGLPEAPKGGQWATGYLSYQGVYFIFCGVGVPGRTGHDYGNRFDGDELLWSGKTGSRKGQPTINKMTEEGAEVHIFWRQDNRHKFTYAGLGRAVSISDDMPVRIRWQLRNELNGVEGISAEEIIVPKNQDVGLMTEGARKQITVNAYERNPQARKKCIEVHGCTCAACGFDFENTYGPRGRGFIHVHHIRPISSIGQSYELKPERDLIPLCPNCHAMVHRSDPPATVEELRTLIANDR